MFYYWIVTNEPFSLQLFERFYALLCRLIRNDASYFMSLCFECDISLHWVGVEVKKKKKRSLLVANTQVKYNFLQCAQCALSQHSSTFSMQCCKENLHHTLKTTAYTAGNQINILSNISLTIIICSKYEHDVGKWLINCSVFPSWSLLLSQI